MSQNTFGNKEHSVLFQLFFSENDIKNVFKYVTGYEPWLVHYEFEIFHAHIKHNSTD